MFSSSTPPESKRPVLRPAKSTGWSWPRLVTVQESPQKPTPRDRGDSTAGIEQRLQMMDKKSPPTSTTAPASYSAESELHDQAEQISPLSTIDSREDSEETDSQAPHPTESARRQEPMAVPVARTIPDSEQIMEDCNKDNADDNIKFDPVTNPVEAVQEPNNSEVPPTIPIIKIQGPSRDQSESGTNYQSAQPTIDSVLAEERKRTTEEEADRGVEQARSGNIELVAVLPQPTDTGAGTTIVPARLKKRKLALRKTRNALARKTMLKAGLGRQLAIPVKEALQRQANGEDVTMSDIKVIG